MSATLFAFGWVVVGVCTGVVFARWVSSGTGPAPTDLEVGIMFVTAMVLWPLVVAFGVIGYLLTLLGEHLRVDR